MTQIQIGKGEVQFNGSGIAILAFGSMVHTCLDIATKLDATLVNMRFIKPLDMELVKELSRSHDVLITVEENAVSGGAGSAVNELLAAEGIVMPILNIGIPDQFIEHGSREDCLAEANLDTEGVMKQIMARLQSLGMARQSTDLPVMKSG
jgi:1-deoxy-D-xylulose-5-phosphate synthase